MHVQQVGNDLGELRMRQRRAHHAGHAMVQRRHRVEQVGEAARAARQRRDAVFVGAGVWPICTRKPAAASCGIASMLPGTSGASVSRRIGASALQLLQFRQRHRPREIGLRAQLAAS